MLPFCPAPAPSCGSCQRCRIAWHGPAQGLSCHSSSLYPPATGLDSPSFGKWQGPPFPPAQVYPLPASLSLSASRARCRKHPSLIKTKAACLRMAPEGTVPSPQRQAGSCPSLVASGQSPFRAVEHRQVEVRRRHQARPEHPAWRPRKCQAPLSLQTEMWIPSRVRRHWDEEGDCSLLPSSEEAGQPTEIC